MFISEIFISFSFDLKQFIKIDTTGIAIKIPIYLEVFNSFLNSFIENEIIINKTLIAKTKGEVLIKIVNVNIEDKEVTTNEPNDK